MEKITSRFKKSPYKPKIEKKQSALFEISDREIKSLIKDFNQQKDNKDNKFFLETYIKFTRNLKVPEKKIYLAIDVGGSFLKIGLYKIKKGVIKQLSEVKEYFIPISGVNDMSLFEWIVQRYIEFITENNYHAKKISKIRDAALTFSYPVKMLSLRSGKIISMGKNYAFNNIKGLDPVGLMNAEFARYGFPITVGVILNDTTSTLLSAHYINPKTRVGIVLGTGTNAAYIQENGKIINTEWGHFIPSSLHIKKDEKDIIISSTNKKYVEIEDLIGGNSLVKYLMNVNNLKNINETKRMFHLYNKNPDSEDLNVKLIRSYKERAMKIISALTYALLKHKTVKHLVLGINGSGLKERGDIEMLRKYIFYVFNVLFDRKLKKVSFERLDDASLRGSIYSLDYSGFIPKEH